MRQPAFSDGVGVIGELGHADAFEQEVHAGARLGVRKCAVLLGQLLAAGQVAESLGQRRRLVAVLERDGCRVALERSVGRKLTLIDLLAITVQNCRLDFQRTVAVVEHRDLDGVGRLVVGVAGGNGLRRRRRS